MLKKLQQTSANSSTKISEQNALVDASQLAQIQRLVKKGHYTVQSNTPNTQFDNLCVLQLANGADVGYQYYSDKAFAEFLNLLDLEIICHIVMLIQASRSCHWKVTAPQITKFHKKVVWHASWTWRLCCQQNCVWDMMHWV